MYHPHVVLEFVLYTSHYTANNLEANFLIHVFLIKHVTNNLSVVFLPISNFRRLKCEIFAVCLLKHMACLINLSLPPVTFMSELYSN